MSSKVLAVAPMMGYTDINFLKLLNLLVPTVHLYTEMLVSQAFIRAPEVKIKELYQIQGRLILQLGGSDAVLLSECADKARRMGYDAVNLNVGCPSPRVVSGAIGAVLMRSPEIVAECVAAMATILPTSVKTRIGVDQDPDNLDTFVAMMSGCSEFIVHARRAWLKGLDPKQNRTIPPLDYDRIVALKDNFPKYTVVLNGGLTSSETIQPYLHLLDGFMIGRAFYANPLNVIRFCAGLGLCQSEIDINAVMHEYLAHIEQHGFVAAKHLLTLLRGFPGAASMRFKLQQMLVSKKIDRPEIMAMADIISKNYAVVVPRS